jgi:hypothetical protein
MIMYAPHRTTKKTTSSQGNYVASAILLQNSLKNCSTHFLPGKQCFLLILYIITDEAGFSMEEIEKARWLTDFFIIVNVCKGY